VRGREFHVDGAAVMKARLPRMKGDCSCGMDDQRIEASDLGPCVTACHDVSTRYAALTCIQC